MHVSPDSSLKEPQQLRTCRASFGSDERGPQLHTHQNDPRAASMRNSGRSCTSNAPNLPAPKQRKSLAEDYHVINATNHDVEHENSYLHVGLIHASLFLIMRLVWSRRFLIYTILISS